MQWQIKCPFSSEVGSTGRRNKDRREQRISIHFNSCQRQNTCSLSFNSPHCCTSSSKTSSSSTIKVHLFSVAQVLKYHRARVQHIRSLHRFLSSSKEKQSSVIEFLDHDFFVLLRFVGSNCFHDILLICQRSTEPNFNLGRAITTQSDDSRSRARKLRDFSGKEISQLNSVETLSRRSECGPIAHHPVWMVKSARSVSYVQKFTKTNQVKVTIIMISNWTRRNTFFVWSKRIAQANCFDASVHDMMIVTLTCFILVKPQRIVVFLVLTVGAGWGVGRRVVHFFPHVLLVQLLSEPAEQR